MGRYSANAESEWMADYGIKDVACDELPPGVLTGTLELFACDGGNWQIRKPERADTLEPKNQPQPVWFYPF